MHARARWALPLSFLLAAACSSSEDSASTSAACEPNPELSIQPARLASNRLASNGSNLNRLAGNGSNLNRLATNGSNLNGVVLNGTWLNGTNLNRIALNGVWQNGSNLNGSNLNGVQVNGAFNELVATTSDGRLVSGDALVGTKILGVLTDGTTVELAIASFERAVDASVAYYGITFEGQNICDDGQSGMFVPGAWDGRAARHDRLVVGTNEISVTFSCRTGVIAKCVTWGYVPWTVGADLHQSCTRMTRADYCGTGVAYTKDDTLIDVFDSRGIQVPTASDPSLAFEAGWGPNGAVCVSRTRYAATTTAGDAKLPSCWSALPKCASFEEAKAAGATLGNGSRIQSRILCN